MIRSTDDSPFNGDQTKDADRYAYDGRDFDPEAVLQYDRRKKRGP
jgi:hypothetical protein